MDMAQRQTPKHSTSTFGDTSFVVPEEEGVQLHPRRNLFQLASLLVFAAIGATIGWFLTDNRPDLAALVGGVLGMIVGTFLSGFVLMLMPAPTITITPQAFGRKRLALKRRLKIATIAFAVCVLSSPLIISKFGHEDSDFSWGICLFWGCLTAGLCAYTKGLALSLRECKCPACGKPFGRLGSACGNCGFQIAPNCAKAIEPSDATERSTAG